MGNSQALALGFGQEVLGQLRQVEAVGRSLMEVASRRIMASCQRSFGLPRVLNFVFACLYLLVCFLFSNITSAWILQRSFYLICCSAFHLII